MIELYFLGINKRNVLFNISNVPHFLERWFFNIKWINLYEHLQQLLNFNDEHM